MELPDANDIHNYETNTITERYIDKYLIGSPQIYIHSANTKSKTIKSMG